MAFVVRRPAGRWEVRESITTSSGPRARSLATFRVLTDDVLGRAERAATTPFDRADVVAAARRGGAPVAESRVDAAARQLLAALAAGDEPSPGLTRLLQHQLRGLATPELAAGDSMADWVGASDEERGSALRDLLGLTDRLPAPRRTKLRFPGLRPVTAVG